MLCSFMDSLYFYGLLALGGLCAHLYEHPPTNSTLSPIWAPTVRRNPAPLITILTLTPLTLITILTLAVTGYWSCLRGLL